MLFRPVRWFDTLPSTNSYLAHSLTEDLSLPTGTVVAARAQTAGRGQFGRTWRAVPQKDLTFSFLLRSSVNLAWIPSLPMAVALSTAEAMHAIGIQARVKWPNDVLVGGSKICGILVEHVPDGSEALLIVGMGINVNATARDLEDIDRPATSVQIETGHSVPLEQALDMFLKPLPKWLDRWEREGFPGIREDWIRSAVGIGKGAVIRQTKNELHGVLEGFGQHGEVVLRQPCGKRRLIWSGDLDLGNSVA